MSKVLYVVDASNWCYKFSNAYTLTRTINGVDISVSALFGFVRAVKSSPFTDIAFCVDGTPELSNRLLKTYKGNRSKEDNISLKVPFKHIMEVLPAVGKQFNKNVYVLAAANQEADQVISSVCHLVTGNVPNNYEDMSYLHNTFNPLYSDSKLESLAENADQKPFNFKEFDTVIISTTDSDMYQLKELGNVYIDSSTNGAAINYSNETPKAVEGLPPECIVAYKMIAGDTSDCVPALKVSYKKSQLLTLIATYLTSKDKIKKFVQEVTHFKEEVDSDPLSKLKHDLSSQAKQLCINYEVVHLVYLSIPIQLSYLDVDYKEILKKYRISI